MTGPKTPAITPFGAAALLEKAGIAGTDQEVIFLLETYPVQDPRGKNEAPQEA